MENNLLFFYGTECEHCEKMMPLIERLEKELGIQFTRYEVWHDKKTHALWTNMTKTFVAAYHSFTIPNHNNGFVAKLCMKG